MAGSQRTPSRAPSFAGSIDAQGTTPNAALVGAALAFGRRRPPPSNAGANGVYNGAGAAGQRSKNSSPEGKQSAEQVSPSDAYRPTLREETGQKVRASSPVYMRRSLTGEPAGVSSLRVPSTGRGPSQSPSRSAAVVAASRASGPIAQETLPSSAVKPVAPPKPRRLSIQQRVTRDEPGRTSTDDTPIPPTTSLVDLFERKSNTPSATPTSRKVAPLTVRPSTPLAARSTAPLEVSDAAVSHGDDDDDSQEESYVSASEDTASSPNPVNRDHPSVVTRLQPPTPNRRRLSPSPARAPYGATKPIDIKPPPRSMSATMTALSPSSYSGQSITAAYHQMYPRRMTPLTTGEDIANAIVASSLASSRAGSPGKLEPPSLPPSRRQRHGLQSRTPSPAKKGMRQTLRDADPSSSDSDDELHPYGKHKKKRHLRKHPNKHHEGERKRWREAVTERERKRYEGVWAANRGLHCSLLPREAAALRQAHDASRMQEAQDALRDQISAVVAHDLWSRSRLPDHELESVWNLVDSSANGRLCKEEFVVGLWLIDQRLKGRKLPTKVSATVWASVKGIEGIKVKKFLG